MKTVAVVGAGGMGQFHAATLAALQGVELAAVCDVNVDTATKLAKTYGIEPTTDPAAVASAGYDGVVIASPDETHSELTLLAMKAGSRVLCEKPLSNTLTGAQAVVDAESELGQRRVQLGFMRRFDPAHLALEAELQKLGEIQYLRCTHRNTNAIARAPEVVMVQSLVHDIHTVHWLAGTVTAVDARVIERPGGLGHVLLILRLASGATASVEFSDNTYAYEVEVEATTENAMITTAPPQRPRLRIAGDHRTPIGNDWFGWFADAYRAQDRAWVQSLTAPAAIGPSASDSLAAQTVAIAALESMATGEQVAVAI